MEKSVENTRMRHGSPPRVERPGNNQDDTVYLQLRDAYLRHLLSYMKLGKEDHAHISNIFQKMISLSRDALRRMCIQKSGQYAEKHEAEIDGMITHVISKKMYAIAFGLVLSEQINATTTDLSQVLFRYATLSSVRASVMSKCIEIEKQWKAEHRRKELGYDPEKERRLMEYVDLMARKKREIDIKVADYKKQAAYWDDKASKLIDDWNEKSSVIKEYLDAMKIPPELKEEWETQFWDMTPEEKKGFSGDLGVFISKKSEQLMIEKKREFYASTKPDEIVSHFKGRDVHAEIMAMIANVDNAKERFRPQPPESGISGEAGGAEKTAPNTIPLTISL